VIDGKTTGPARASIGLVTTFTDVYRFWSSGSKTTRPSVSSLSRALTTATAVRLDSADIYSPSGPVARFY
jgi:hypothetical protein